MKATMPSLAPEPYPLVEFRERHRAACRMASLYGLDMGNPAHHAEIARLMGWPASVVEADRLDDLAHETEGDGTRHCGPVSEKQRAVKEAASLRNQARRVRQRKV